MTSPQQPMAATPVTILDVYTKQIELGAQLLVIHEQLRAIPDHEQRIRLLEAFKWKLAGGCITAGAIAGGAASWVSLALGRH